MKKIIFCIGLLIIGLNVKAIKVKFTVANMSVNIAEGSEGIFTSIQVYPNNYNNPDSLELSDFPSIDYNDIAEVIIEEIKLSEELKAIFTQTAIFPVTNNSTYGNKINTDFIQGSIYAFRVSVMTTSGQQLNLLNRSITTLLSNPKINCAKLNNVYRLACHNCFQESVIDPIDGGLYQALFYTRVVELDIHVGTQYHRWDVRHTKFPTLCGYNCNNCDYTGPIGSGLNNPLPSSPSNGDRWLGICIDDIKKWHDGFPNHDPIIIHLDLKSDFDGTHTALDLDNLLLSRIPNADIYKPKDLLGNQTNMRYVASLNNWPSMGDLKGKFIIILTGKTSWLNEYMSQRGLDALAFSSLSVETESDAQIVSGISTQLVKNIVFYNVKRSDDLNVGTYAFQNGYMSRTWNSTTVGSPKAFSNSEYAEAINFQINNIAVKDIDGNYNPSNGKPINGFMWEPAVDISFLYTDHIYSSYQNVTQAATQTITATNLIVEPGAHYRMIAGNEIDLQPGVDFKIGSEVDVRIDDCEGANYSLRQATGEQLTQEQIEAMMHELNKDLYSYQPSDEYEIANLSVYPNPTTNSLNISFTNYLRVPITFTLSDITGRIVLTKNYETQQNGRQNFSVNIGALQAGTHFYTLQVGEQTYNGKVVKMAN